MTRQRQILFTVIYNDLGCIIDTKAEPYAEQNLQPTCNQLATDCISRQAAIVVFENSGLDDDSKDTVVRVLEQLPTAQPERKKGKWINHRNDDGHNIADCDQCGNAIQWFDGDEIPRYCCMCGADMRGESE